jgi:hypothetical protein
VSTNRPEKDARCCGHDAALRAANERADRWQSRLDALRGRVTAVVDDDDAFGDLVCALADLLHGQVASAVNGTGSDLVTVERCYASGMAQRVTRLVQDRVRATLGDGDLRGEA